MDVATQNPRRDPKTGETLLVARSSELDTPLLIGDLRKRLKEDPNATAAAYFSGLGMSCKLAGADTKCERAMAAWFVCLYTVDDKPQPADYTTRYPGQVRLVLALSSSDIVKSASAIVEIPDKKFVCPSKR